MIHIYKSTVFLYTGRKWLENEIFKIPFTVPPPKIIKNKLTREVQGFCPENYRTVLR